MARWEQFEVWRLSGTRWEMVASFPDFEVANAVVRKRSSQVRLIHAVYDENKIVEQEVLMELGAPREQP
jgi:hypothetical protein